MGVQRSGTNAFFRCLAHDERYSAFSERPVGPIYSDWFLRPESEIGPVLMAEPGAVLLKPICETYRRSVFELLEEFHAYDVWIPWIYRDPVNVYFSQLQRWNDKDDVTEFNEEWSRRNRMMLEALPALGEKAAVVKYEDLVADPDVLGQLCRHFDVNGKYHFRADSAAGRKNLPEDTIVAIEEGSRAVFRDLDAARRFFPSREAGA